MKKDNVDLDKYCKRPRELSEGMKSALMSGGLHPILRAVMQDRRLRLDIRDNRFNVYYGGGSLLLVDGRKSPWALSFDKRYFKGVTSQRPDLPEQYQSASDVTTWVQAFPALTAGMDEWWKGHSKKERSLCQKMATAHESPQNDYLILDLEYQWAQRRFDMIAARRWPTPEDRGGWVEPDLVFIEVKNDLGACRGTSGLSAHACDYKAIIGAKEGNAVQSIKDEYENVIKQKRHLGLLDGAIPFRRFSKAVPELLIVLVDLDLNNATLKNLLSEVEKIARQLREGGRIQLMQLVSPGYSMTAAKAQGL